MLPIDWEGDAVVDVPSEQPQTSGKRADGRPRDTPLIKMACLHRLSPPQSLGPNRTRTLCGGDLILEDRQGRPTTRLFGGSSLGRLGPQAQSG